MRNKEDNDDILHKSEYKSPSQYVNISSNLTEK